jgi:hypothetical protein
VVGVAESGIAYLIVVVLVVGEIEEDARTRDERELRTLALTTARKVVAY